MVVAYPQERTSLFSTDQLIAMGLGEDEINLLQNDPELAAAAAAMRDLGQTVKTEVPVITSLAQNTRVIQ